MDQQALTNE